MKIISKLLIVTMAVWFTQACSEKTETVTTLKGIDAIDTMTIGCLSTYDLNPLDTSEKINQVYDKGKIKHGHWISFGVAVIKTKNDEDIRTKIEEGYYRFNKKVGFWKFYNQDGSLHDSVEYKNDIPVIKT